jgi:hypothetical protein
MLCVLNPISARGVLLCQWQHSAGLSNKNPHILVNHNTDNGDVFKLLFRPLANLTVGCGT